MLLLKCSTHGYHCIHIRHLIWCHHFTGHICSLGVPDIFDLFRELQRIEVLLLAESLGQIIKCVLECYHKKTDLVNDDVELSHL